MKHLHAAPLRTVGMLASLAGSLLRGWLAQGRRLVVFNRVMAAVLVATAISGLCLRPAQTPTATTAMTGKITSRIRVNRSIYVQALSFGQCVLGGKV